jgi:cold shock CspA family protein
MAQGTVKWFNEAPDDDGTADVRSPLRHPG